MTELTLMKESTVTLPPSNDTVLKHTFKGIKYGGKYRITVATDVQDAIPSMPVDYDAPPILPPHQLTVMHDDNSYVLYWQERPLPEAMTKSTKYQYEILVSEGERTVNETSAKVFKTDQPPYIYKDPKTNVIYSFAVRLVTEEGYKSMQSEVASIQSPLGEFTIRYILSFDTLFLFRVIIPISPVVYSSCLLSPQSVRPAD